MKSIVFALVFGKLRDSDDKIAKLDLLKIDEARVNILSF